MTESSIPRLALAVALSGALACDSPSAPAAPEDGLAPAYDLELAGPLAAALDDAVLRLPAGLGPDGAGLRASLLGLRTELERRRGEEPADAAAGAASAVATLERMITASLADGSTLPGAELSAVLLAVMRVDEALFSPGADRPGPAGEAKETPSMTDPTNRREQ